jgi:uncharacterized SAM-binding protein YcdF (DUF218 family)
VASFLILSDQVLIKTGEFLVFDERPREADAVVVLNTGLEYYPRLMEAARLFRDGVAGKIVINGNRKTDALRSLENKGFTRCCSWFEDALRILLLLGVPRSEVIAISVEDAYDTVSEAQALGDELVRRGLTRIIITTSKFHTRRAHYIWNKIYGGRLEIWAVSAKTDPYDPYRWWKEGRQVRWVLAEYGAWLYFWWKDTGEN